jgi:hypothetical protein
MSYPGKRRMKFVFSFVAVGFCVLAACKGSLGDEPKARPADVASIDSILAALYDVISGPAGAPRDWDRLRSLCVPEARLIPVVTKDGASAVRVMDVDTYIKLADPQFQKNGFYEREIARKTEGFGQIAHVFSTYESRRAKDDAPFARGINSIQLLNDGQRWWIVTIFWDSEKPNSPLPPQYLPKS